MVIMCKAYGYWCFNCMDSSGLGLRGQWICWVVGKEVLADIVLQTWGKFHDASCGLFEENETNIPLKGLRVCG